MRQAEAFLAGEGDAWYERNKSKRRLPDPVLDIISELRLQPKGIMEIGCGDGWRLEALKKKYPDVACWGYETSAIAAETALKKGLWVYQGMSGILHNFHPIDLIIFGFCLYVIDREALFSWVERADSVLPDGGHIIIHDFVPDYPYRRAYEHKKGLWSYKMDHAKLWLAHPGYKEIRTDLFGEDDDRVGVTVIQKDFANAFPVRNISSPGL